LAGCTQKEKTMQTATIYRTEQRQAEFARHKNNRAVLIAPEGYMSAEEFRIEAKASLTKILNERGIY